MMSNQLNYKAAIWGFVVGDALGVPYEFTDREIMKIIPATGMIGFETHHQPPGTWSDDTSMMLCVLENIISLGTAKDLSKAFIRWYTEGYMTPYGELFDIGCTTENAIVKLIAGVKCHLSGDDYTYSAGNGSLMRCLPYAFRKDLPKSICNMLIDNKITHRNSLCNLCCIFYVQVLRHLLDGQDKIIAIKYAIQYIKFGWRISDDDEEGSIIGWGHFKKLFNREFRNLLETEIESTSYVLNTLEAAMWCFLNTDNYKDAVLKAVNLGGDTDTIAALTGGLAGVAYGYDSIPKEWINIIANPSIISSVLNKIPIDSKYIN